MEIITKSFYEGFFGSIDQATFDLFHPIACDIVNRATLRKIEIFGFTNFTQTLQDKISKAVAYQINTMIENGGIDIFNGMSDLNASRVTIGKYSEDSGMDGNFQGSKIRQSEGVPISPMIRIQLYATKLLLNTNRNADLRDINEANP